MFIYKCMPWNYRKREFLGHLSFWQNSWCLGKKVTYSAFLFQNDSFLCSHLSKGIGNCISAVGLATIVKVTLKRVLSVCWFCLFWLISISFPDLRCWWCCVHENLCKRVKKSIYLSSGMKWRTVKSHSVMSIHVCCY